MKNVTKPNLIIVLLVLNFISVLGLLYIARKQTEKMNRLSYEIDYKTSNYYQKRSRELDFFLFGDDDK